MRHIISSKLMIPVAFCLSAGLTVFGAASHGAAQDATAAAPAAMPEPQHEGLTLTMGNALSRQATLRGIQRHIYTMTLAAGDALELALSADNAGTQMELSGPSGVAPGLDAEGLGKGKTVTIPEAGTYTLTVALSAVAARRDEQSTYSLRIEQKGKTGETQAATQSNTRPAPRPDAATSQATGTAPVARPETASAQPDSATQALATQPANRPTARPAGAADPAPAPAESAAPQGSPLASSQIPCSTALGMPTTQCLSRLYRDESGTFSLSVQRPDGSARVIRFDSAKPVVEPGATVQTRGKLWVIEYQSDQPNAERYEIPMQFITGG